MALTNTRSSDPSESAAAYNPDQAHKRFLAKTAQHPRGCIVWTASLWKQGYGQFYFAGRAQKAHRVAFELAYGPIPPGIEIDHICFRRACVNLAHLRPVTRKQNMEHRNGANGNSKSGVRGVSWHKRMRKWAAYVRHNKVGYHVGYFDSLEEAGTAVLAKRNELFSHNDEVAAA